MEYRYPRWPAYAVLALLLFFVGVGIYGFTMETANRPASDGDALVGVLLAAAVAFCLYGLLYLSRYRVWINDDCLVLAGAFRSRSIPLPRIVQVLTTSTPRGGTNTLLLDENDNVLGRLDGSLTEFNALLVDLGQKLRAFQSTFYRYGLQGQWEMQAAGDMQWVPSAPPRYARTNTRRQGIILVVGCFLIAVFAWVAAWLEHGGFDKLLGP